jgi:aminopeptidase N
MPATRTLLLAALVSASTLAAQQPVQVPGQTPNQKAATTPPARPAPETPAPPPKTPTHAAILRGAYGPFRANNDLLYYHLDIRVDPVARTIAGKNTIRFKMLQPGSRIQLDLSASLQVDKIVLGADELKYTRDGDAVFIEFPKPLAAGQTYSIDFLYSGSPRARGRFGGVSFSTDPAGRPWIFSADEDDGSSIYWPSKDQWTDEPQDGMDISVAVPNDLMDVSNGRLVSHIDLKDGYTQWNWHVSYPINNYDVALNIGAYQHISDTYKNPEFAPLSLDFYALPEDLEKARIQFAQAKGMIEAFEHYFGEYPFARDGYKLVEVPYSGMEHQSAVAYGNHFVNGYLEKDWTGVGISPRFDFIIIHESGHEWFGNAITAQDRSDMWIHEGWTTYLESLYVEYRWGKADGLLYNSGYIPKIHNRTPIITERGAGVEPPQDMYFKGTMMIASLRSWIDDDPKWFALLKAFFQHFKYQDIMTEDVVAWWSEQTHSNLAPFFNQYLRHTAIPALELNFDPLTHTVMYKWQADETGFDMPVKVGDPAHWQTIHPTTKWQVMNTPLGPDDFKVATDLFYINVSKT